MRGRGEVTKLLCGAELLLLGQAFALLSYGLLRRNFRYKHYLWTAVSVDWHITHRHLTPKNPRSGACSSVWILLDQTNHHATYQSQHTGRRLTSSGQKQVNQHIVCSIRCGFWLGIYSNLIKAGQSSKSRRYRFNFSSDWLKVYLKWFTEEELPSEKWFSKKIVPLCTTWRFYRLKVWRMS